MQGTVSAAKHALRKEIRRRLKRLTSEEKRQESENIVRKLLESDEYRNSRRIAIYLSMDDEIDTIPIVKNIFETRRLCFVPRFHGDAMDMVQLHSWEDYLSLPVTKWNIKQPAVNDASRADALDSGGLDLVVTPGLGFTKDGLRLGRGKGYYDAFLAKCAAVKIPKTIGLAFSVQLCENIPVGPKDIQIDKVLYQ